jgi:ribosomal protein S18 acetylase RimI-like enzyme
VIVPFRPELSTAFHDLNIAWIERLFHVEAADLKTLEHPQEAIIDHGGEIFFALVDGVVVGCCAAVHEGDGRWELSKMAVDPAYQGQGLGEALGHAVVQHALVQGARELYLLANSSLHGAIRLYERLGFRHRPMPGDTPYARSDVYMVFSERQEARSEK